MAQESSSIAGKIDMSNSSGITLRSESIGGCRLLELPGELRNEIFKLALYQPDVVVLDMRSTKEENNKYPIALTQTCKQTHYECGDLFFELNEVKMEMRHVQLQPPTQDEKFRNMSIGWRERFRNKGLASKVQKVHLSFGKIRSVKDDVVPFAILAARGIRVRAAQRQQNVQIRVSFGLMSDNDSKVCHDYKITDVKQTLEAMDRCFHGAGLGRSEISLSRLYCKWIPAELREGAFSPADI